MSLQLITRRKSETWPSWDSVFEWEDVFVSGLNISFHDISKEEMFIDRVIGKIGLNPFSILSGKTYFLLFEMAARIKNSIYNRKNVIPCIIDFHLQKTDLDNFYKAYLHCPFLLITSFEAYSFLKENNFPKRIYHYPFSISDKYKITEQSLFEKKYDLVMFGRQNPKLEEFTKMYSEKHPEFMYVYRKLENNSFNYYTSTQQYVGDINKREEYLRLISQSRVALYHTPGIDGGEERTKGFNQVTLRFFEAIACGCHIIARYKENPDTGFYELNKFSPSINTYEAFENAMNNALSKSVDMKMYADYLEKHYTSKRVELLKEILGKENISIN